MVREPPIAPFGLNGKLAIPPPGLNGKVAIDETCFVLLDGLKMSLIFCRKELPARPLVFILLVLPPLVPRLRELPS